MSQRSLRSNGGASQKSVLELQEDRPFMPYSGRNFVVNKRKFLKPMSSIIPSQPLRRHETTAIENQRWGDDPIRALSPFTMEEENGHFNEEQEKIYENLKNSFATSSSACNKENDQEEVIGVESNLQINSAVREAEPRGLMPGQAKFIPVQVKNADGTTSVYYDFVFANDNSKDLQPDPAKVDPNEYLRSVEEQYKAKEQSAEQTETLCCYNWPEDSDSLVEFKVSLADLSTIEADTVMRTQIGHILLAKCGDAERMKKICLGEPRKPGHETMPPEWWALLKSYYQTRNGHLLDEGDDKFKATYWRGLRCFLEDHLKGKRNHVPASEAVDQSQQSAKRRMRGKKGKLVPATTSSNGAP